MYVYARAGRGQSGFTALTCEECGVLKIYLTTQSIRYHNTSFDGLTNPKANLGDVHAYDSLCTSSMVVAT